jgi:hypothetical protein
MVSDILLCFALDIGRAQIYIVAVTYDHCGHKKSANKPARSFPKVKVPANQERDQKRKCRSEKSVEIQLQSEHGNPITITTHHQSPTFRHYQFQTELGTSSKESAGHLRHSGSVAIIEPGKVRPRHQE